jgi:hypothetical protein
MTKETKTREEIDEEMEEQVCYCFGEMVDFGKRLGEEAFGGNFDGKDSNYRIYLDSGKEYVDECRKKLENMLSYDLLRLRENNLYGMHEASLIANQAKEKIQNNFMHEMSEIEDRYWTLIAMYHKTLIIL